MTIFIPFSITSELIPFFVRFLAVNPFICLAEWANVYLYFFHKIINYPLLVVTGMEAYRA